MSVTKDDRKKIREFLFWLADTMILLDDIEEMPACNDCGIKMHCAYCPRIGAPVRYNCPLLVPEKQAKEEDGQHENK